MIHFQQLTETDQALLNKLKQSQPIIWLNPNMSNCIIENHSFSFRDVLDAEQRLSRFARYIRVVFPETENLQGIIESKLNQFHKS